MLDKKILSENTMFNIAVVLSAIISAIVKVGAGLVVGSSVWDQPDETADQAV